MQQTIKYEMLSQQQQSQGSPKRDNRPMITQGIMHQTSYGMTQMSQTGIIAGTNVIGMSVGSDGNGGGAVAGAGSAGRGPIFPNPASLVRQRNLLSSLGGNNATTATNETISCNTNTIPPHLSMAYYAQQPQTQPYYGDAIHPMQVSANHNDISLSIFFSHL